MDFNKIELSRDFRQLHHTGHRVNRPILIDEAQLNTPVFSSAKSFLSAGNEVYASRKLRIFTALQTWLSLRFFKNEEESPDSIEQHTG